MTRSGDCSTVSVCSPKRTIGNSLKVVKLIGYCDSHPVTTTTTTVTATPSTSSTTSTDDNLKTIRNKRLMSSTIIRPSDMLKQVRNNANNFGNNSVMADGVNIENDRIFSTDSEFLGNMLESLLNKWSQGNGPIGIVFFKHVVSNLYSQRREPRYRTVIKFLAGVRARLCFFGEMKKPKRDLKQNSSFMKVNQSKLLYNEIYYEMVILLSRQYKKALFNSPSMNRMSSQDKMYLWGRINDSIKLKAKRHEFSTNVTPSEQLSSIILEQCSIAKSTFNLLDLASKIVDNTHAKTPENIVPKKL